MLRNIYSLKNRDKYIKELTAINGSLSSLGQCISALADPKRKHVPFRNSKLTKILKDSLEISAKIALIICISPSLDSYDETVSTLQFADRAKKAILLAQDDNRKAKGKTRGFSTYRETTAPIYDNKEANKKIKELMEENKELKNQIMLFKNSSYSKFMTPQKSTETFSSKITEFESFPIRKLKYKKKSRRKKGDYLNPSIETSVNGSSKSRNYITGFKTAQTLESCSSLKTLRSSFSVKSRKSSKKRKVRKKLK